ncbi:MBG domain-containing protein [Paucibacter sp. Y2R2-4]|uniref:MBG domain-containing protein n=1 Tax=Paucibacter sp. Y2R2-4 TaxID=2893553 RepID=UPI0021E4949E|nr:MBG domain-containing protein [Paucibacter sp. Y2R2-4]MCV2349200.1 filamentous hemagglutinin N-terminal domain-containing protein [Paucibacter sp. Y2R2-4]
MNDRNDAALSAALVFKAELGAKGLGGRRACRRSQAPNRLRDLVLCMSACFAAGMVSAQATGSASLPSGAQVVAGQAQISRVGNVLTVQQNSALLATDWRSFNIGAGHTVNFVQPSSSSVALNRVIGNEVSRIQGALNANGQVFLLNPNGVLFTPTAQVNVGALVASTLQLDTPDFLAGRYHFRGNSGNAIINQGRISAAPGGAVALIAAKVSNSGSIAAPGGQVLVGAGSKVVLDLGGPVKLKVDEAAIDALIEQGGAIKADGGLVYLTAKAAGRLASTVINHTGVTEAQTLATGETGQIYLMGGMEKDRILVGGRLDASAPQGGAGGFVETSAARVDFHQGRVVTTYAAAGRSGTWLIDPNDYTIAASGGNITGSQLGTDLASGNVTISTATQGSAGGNGDIFVNDPVSWSANTTLTLTAQNNINVNANISSSNASAGGVIFLFGQAAADGGSSVYTQAGAASVTGWSQQWRKGSAANGLRYASVNGDLFLGNQYIEIGINKALGGKLGASNKPSLFFGRKPGLSGIGMTGDADGFGVGTDLRIDYFLPGSPEERFTAGYDIAGTATSGANFATSANGAVYRLLGVGSDGAIGTEVSATLAGNLKVTQTMKLVSGQRYFTNDVALENVGSATLNNVTFIRSFDPDNTVDQGGGYTTKQSIDNTRAAGDAYNVVSATSAAGDAYATLSGGSTAKIFYYSSNANSSVGFGSQFFGGTLAGMVTRAASQVKGNNETADTGMGILFKPGTLAPGASSSFNITTGLDNRPIDVAVGGISAPSVIAVSYTLAPLSVVYKGGAYDLYSLWAPGVVFGSGYTGWVAGTDYQFKLGGSVVSGLANAGSYTGLSVEVLKSGYSTAASGNTLGSLLISPAPLTISANNARKTYDGASYSGGAGVSYSGFVGSETSSVLSGTLGYTGTSQGAINVGSAYTIRPQGLSSANYAIQFLDGALTIDPRPITVTADAKSKVYGNADPVLTYAVTVGNLVGSDSLSGALTRAPGSNVGSYTIDASSLANGNYLITAQNGVLSITPRPITVTADAKSKVYGNADPALSYAVTAGNLVGDDSLSGALTRAPGSNVGSYTIDASALANGNYLVTAQNGVLSITPRPITVTADAKSKVYGNADPALTYAVTSGDLVGSDSLSGALTRTAGSNVGSYAIDASSLANGNYLITAQNGVLSITPRPITVTADAKNKTYGEADPALSYQISSGNLVSGDRLGGALSRAAGESIGSHAISAQGLNNGNYAITAIDSSLVIAPAVNANVIAGNTPSATNVISMPPALTVPNFGNGAFTMIDVPAAPTGSTAGDSSGTSTRSAGAAPPLPDNTASMGSTGSLRMLVVGGGIKLPEIRITPANTQEGGKE